MGLSLSSISLARPPGIAMKGKLDGRDASITLLEKDLSLSLIQFVKLQMENQGISAAKNILLIIMQQYLEHYRSPSKNVIHGV